MERLGVMGKLPRSWRSIFQHERVCEAHEVIYERDISEQGAPSLTPSGRVRRLLANELMRVFELTNNLGSRISAPGHRLLTTMGPGYRVSYRLNLCHGKNSVLGRAPLVTISGKHCHSVKSGVLGLRAKNLKVTKCPQFTRR
jgi:hypothetical protein